MTLAPLDDHIHIMPNLKLCKYHPKCKNQSCTYAHPQQPNRKKSSTCAYFLRGGCVYGPECRRSHEPEVHDNNEPSRPMSAKQSDPASDYECSEEKSPCTFYLMGGCGNGEQCEFAHINPGEQATCKANSCPALSLSPFFSPCSSLVIDF